MRKILAIIAKTVGGLIAFYLIAGFIILPWIATGVIRDQGRKVLKHTVQVRSVSFNPVLFILDLNDVAVLDGKRQVMAGFKHLKVDVSFLSLFKKEYLVELVELDGLQVNATLQSGGKLNLLELVPASPQAGKSAASSGQTKAGGAPGAGTAPVTLPLVTVAKFDLRQGTVRFTDETVTPVFSTAVEEMQLEMSSISTKPDVPAKAIFNARLGEKGIISAEAAMKPLAQPLEAELTLSMNDYALTVLTPYVGKYTGRSLKDGELGFQTSYRISNNKLSASHKVLIQRFEFGQKVQSKDALPLPFGLAVALLEDPQGRINISLPVSGDMSKPDFHYWHLVGQVIRNFFMGLVTKPFSFLASALGAEAGTDELGMVRFVPGSAVLPDAERDKLRILIKGLKDRPRLLLEIGGSADPDADWHAIKAEALEKEYADLRQHSTRSESWVYQMIYQRRFGIRDLWDLTRQYKIKEGVYKDEALVKEMRRQLIEKAPPDKAALDALANARAQAVYDAVIKWGMDKERVRLIPPKAGQASMGVVPLEFTLTVFDEPPAASPERMPGQPPQI